MESLRTLRLRLTRLPPLDGGIPATTSLLRAGDPALERRVTRMLQRRLRAAEVWLLASGREALRLALALLAERSGRDEVVLPAYTCWSVPAAAVAAGMRVRLVDVDARGRIDRRHLATLPLERAAAVVVSNLFGCAEPLRLVERLVRSRGVAVIDDAAQSLGAIGSDGAVGSRGACSVLSFGRGKPLQALGGGALVWHTRPPRRSAAAAARPRPLSAWALAQLWNAAVSPPAFSLIASVPGAGVGLTRFDPDFRRGPIRGAHLVLCAHALEHFEARTRRRAAVAATLAAGIHERTAFEPVTSPPGEQAAHPRLAVLAPDRGHRDAALRELAGAGASGLYPASLDAIPALAESRVGSDAVPGARALAERVFTLPTHGSLDAAGWEKALAALERIAPEAEGPTCAAS